MEGAVSEAAMSLPAPLPVAPAQEADDLSRHKTAERVSIHATARIRNWSVPVCALNRLRKKHRDERSAQRLGLSCDAV